HILVARRVTRQSSLLESKFLAGLRIRRNLQIHRPSQGRHFDGGAQSRLPGGDWQSQGQIFTIHTVERMWRQLDFQKQIARLAATDSRATLPLETDVLACAHAGWNFYLEGFLPVLHKTLAVRFRHLDLNLP